jgi:hypothetical protein
LEIDHKRAVGRKRGVAQAVDIAGGQSEDKQEEITFAKTHCAM